MRMALGRHWGVRCAGVVLLLCALLCAQVVAFATESVPHHAADHCCLLCHIGVQPFLQSDSQVSTAPVAPVQLLVREADCDINHDPVFITSSSRAPPATIRP